MDFKISDDYANNRFTWDGTEILPGIKDSIGSPAGLNNGAGLVSELMEWAIPAYNIGFRTVGPRQFSGNDGTTEADSGKAVMHVGSDAAVRTFQISDETHGGVSHPPGTVITIINQHGAGDLTIICYGTMRLAGSGDSSFSRTLTQDGIATAVKVTDTEWLISGVNLT